MAPVRNHTKEADGGDERSGVASDRKMRKPLVEKKRRARINESLQELRVLMADADPLQSQSKMENAEVLEMTVKRVEGCLLNRAQEVDAASREACERFAAGYIQCMHDVHTFVSSCPEMEPTVAAELLNHLLESMPLNDEDSLRALLPDTAEDPPGNNSAWSVSESMYATLVSPAPSTTSTSTSTDDLCSDLDETYSEQSHVSSEEEADGHDALSLPSLAHSKSMWRPW
uniref:Transcription cofactor HES-6 n=1 Tax=Gasterosteus aculeatus TaxID=69293 RepID=G3PJN9_GASAC